MVDRTRRIVSRVVDSAPGLLFIATYLVTRDFRQATMVLVGSAVLALAAMIAVERRLRPLPTVVAAMAVVFGGLSLALHDPQILKMKMTIVDGLLGAILFAGLAIGKNPLKLLLGAAFNLSDKAWSTLAIRYGAFWWICAAANELVRRTQSDHVWVLFRAGAIAAAVLFALAQVPFLIRHGATPPAVEPPPPDLSV